jgi:hypothetical protein
MSDIIDFYISTNEKCSLNVSYTMELTIHLKLNVYLDSNLYKLLPLDNGKYHLASSSRRRNQTPFITKFTTHSGVTQLRRQQMIKTQI